MIFLINHLHSSFLFPSFQLADIFNFIFSLPISHRNLVHQNMINCFGPHLNHSLIFLNYESLNPYSFLYSLTSFFSISIEHIFLRLWSQLPPTLKHLFCDEVFLTIFIALENIFFGCLRYSVGGNSITELYQLKKE